MVARFHRSAFTLIEVLIVVVIVSVLAAIIIPQVTDCSNDAKSSSLKHNLYTMRAQIEMYKLSHGGSVPALQNNTLAQLISATDSTGALGTPGPTFPFGPYIAGGKSPVNPFDQKSTVSSTAVFPPTATTSAGGWLYNEASGQIAANTDGHLND
jgi:general secretion pathway protein G